MEVGAHVWVRCEQQVWAPGVVLDCQEVRATGHVKVKLANGDIVTRVYENGDREGITQVHLRNSGHDFRHVPCLIDLEQLHEPALLHALSERFRSDLIYTYIGDILLAMNPLKCLDIYSEKHVEAYKALLESSRSHVEVHSKKPPHVFAIAAKAYRGLVDEDNGRNQSILVSGESGSGKTETTKFLMQFLTAIGQSHHMEDNSLAGAARAQYITEIGKRILQTNPILESFGNAQTIRNDNSSRFGKFIKLQFGANNEIVGAEISSYLLEKVRLIHQSPQERSFHIFYELLEGADADLMRTLGLKRGARYEFLNHYNGTARKSSLCSSYGKRFVQTVTAMEDTGLEETERMRIFQVLAALLHLGNVRFKQTAHSPEDDHQNEGASIDIQTTEHLAKCAELLGVSVSQLESLLLTREITAGSDVLLLRIDAVQAQDVCRSLAKCIYGRMFTWLVSRLSDCINYRQSISSAADLEDDVKTIGILDIFGFESLESNGFEQLCINYANERLQAQFNEFVFEKEQKLYIQNGIEWTSITYPDNAACLSMFDDKAGGLFSLLDQECMIPKGSNQALCTKFYRYHGEGELLSDNQATLPAGAVSNKYSLPMLMNSFGKYLNTPEKQPSAEKRNLPPMLPFSASKMDRVRQQFVVHHFAGKVCYRVEDFLEKNQDTLPPEVTQLLLSSSNTIIHDIGLMQPTERRRSSDTSSNTTRRRSSLLRGPSVSAQFKSQLDLLVEEIGETEAHYIRCLKPNEDKSANTFDRKRVVEQLRSVGVLEALRIARAGYSTRMTHEAFNDRFYSFDSPQKQSQGDLVERTVRICLRLLKRLHIKDNNSSFNDMDIAISTKQFNEIARSDGVQIGNAMVFCKRDVFNQLLQLRADVRNQAATRIQASWRSYRAKILFCVTRRHIVAAQAQVRCFLARRFYRRLTLLRRSVALRKIERMIVGHVKHERKTRHKARLFRLRRAFQKLSALPAAEEQDPVQVEEAHFKTVKKAIESEEANEEQSWTSTSAKTTTSSALLAASDEDEESCARTTDLDSPPSTYARRYRSSRMSDRSTRSKRSELPERRRVRRRKPRKSEPFNDPLEQRNRQLENEIQRLQQLLGASSYDSVSQVSRTGSSRDGRGPRRRPWASPESTRRRIFERRDQRSRCREFEMGSSDEEHGGSDPYLDEPHPDMDLPLPRRTQSLYQSNDQVKVSLLTRRLEELDMKCQFLEQMVSHTHTADDNRYGHPHHQSMYGWDPRRPDERSMDYKHHRVGMGSTGHMHVRNADTSHVDSAMRNLQRQMDLLRQSVAMQKEDPHRHYDPSGSIASSYPTQSSASRGSSSSISTTAPLPDRSSIEGAGFESAMLVSPRERDSSCGSHTTLSQMSMPPATPTNSGGFPSSAPPPRSAPGYLGGGRSAGPPRPPRIVKWARANFCFECEEPFSLFVRRHHCRMCGNSFCHEHSSRRVSIFGIGFDDEPVRVCDACFADYYAYLQDPYGGGYSGSLAPTPMSARGGGYGMGFGFSSGMMTPTGAASHGGHYGGGFDLLTPRTFGTSSRRFPGSPSAASQPPSTSMFSSSVHDDGGA